MNDSLVFGASPDRVAGSDRYSTAAAVSREGWESSEFVVLATGAQFPDAIVGAPLAYAYGAPLLLTSSSGLSKATANEIERLGATDVIVLGGEGAVGAKVLADLRSLGIDGDHIERIGGVDRYETAAQVASRVVFAAGKPSAAVIATGRNPYDALAIAGYASANGMPIILSNKDALPDASWSALSSMAATQTIVMGGESVISADVTDVLPDPVRIGGADRYETAAQAGNYAFQHGFSFETVLVATGLDFPDALASAPWAAMMRAPLVLTNGTSLSSATKTFVKSHCSSIESILVLGGTSAIADGVLRSLEDAAVTRLNPAAQPLDEHDAGTIADVTTETIVFEPTSPVLLGLEPGDILVSDSTPEAPYGFLRKVVSVQGVSPTSLSGVTGVGVSVETTIAALEEVIEKGSIDVTMPVTFDLSDVTAIEPVDANGVAGVSPGPDDDLADPVELRFADPVSDALSMDDKGLAETTADGDEGNFDVVIYDKDRLDGTVDDQVSLELGIQPRLNMHFNIHFEWFQCQNMEFYITGGAEVHAELRTLLSHDFGHNGFEVKLKRWEDPKKDAKFMVGPVPVIIHPQLDVVVGLAGKIDHLTLAGTADVSFKLGISWDKDDGFKPIMGAGASFTTLPPGADSGMDAKYWAGLRVNLLLYGVAGPTFSAKPYFRGIVDVGADPWWETKAGLRLTAGGRLNLIVVEPTLEWAWDLFETRLDAAPGAFGMPRIIKVEPLDPTHIRLGFDAPGKLQAYYANGTFMPQSFTSEGITIHSAELEDEGKSVLLTVSKQTPYETYSVGVNAGAFEDTFGYAVEGSTHEFEGFNKPPRVIDVRAVSSTEVEVEFEALTSIEAVEDSFVVFSAAADVFWAAPLLEVDGKMLTIRTGNQKPGVPYFITVATGDVVDEYGTENAVDDDTPGVWQFPGYIPRPTIHSAWSPSPGWVEVLFEADGAPVASQVPVRVDFGWGTSIIMMRPTPSITSEVGNLSASGFRMTDGVKVEWNTDLYQAYIVDTGTQLRETEYTLTFPQQHLLAKGSYAMPFEDQTTTFWGFTRPRTSSVEAVTPNKVRVKFDAAPGALSNGAYDTATYDLNESTFDPGTGGWTRGEDLGILAVEKDPHDEHAVILTTTEHKRAQGLDLWVWADKFYTGSYPSNALNEVGGGHFTGYTPPVIDSVSPTGKNGLEIVFDALVDLKSATVAPNDFAIPGLTVASVESVTGKTVTLTTSDQSAETTYTVTCPAGSISDLNDHWVQGTSGVFWGRWRPEVGGAHAVDATTVDVWIDSSAVLDGSTVAAGDFTAPGLTVSGASVEADGRTVRLDVSSQSVGTTYTVSVADSSILDIDAMAITAAPTATWHYDPPVPASASATEDDRTVIVDFDGLAPLDPDSLDSSDFTIGGVDAPAVTAVAPWAGGTSVRLTTEAQVKDRAYTVTCAAGSVEDVNGTRNLAGTLAFAGFWAPSVVDMEFIDEKTVDLYFDSRAGLDPASVSSGDFLVLGHTVLGAVVTADPRVVRLTFSDAFIAGQTGSIGCIQYDIRDTNGQTNLPIYVDWTFDPVTGIEAHGFDNGTHVDVSLDMLSRVETATVSAGDFSIPGLTVTDATPLSDGITVRLETSAQTPGTAYTVTLAADSVLNTNDTWNLNSAQAGFVGYRPVTLSLDTVYSEFDSIWLRIASSDDADQTYGARTSHFSVSGTGVNDARLSNQWIDGELVEFVVVSTSGMTAGTTHTVTCSADGVRDALGNRSLPTTITFVYDPPVLDSALAIDLTHVDVGFSGTAGLDPDDIHPADFTITEFLATPTLAVHDAQLLPDGTTIRLTTDPQSSGEHRGWVVELAGWLTTVNSVVSEPQGFGLKFESYHGPELIEVSAVDTDTVLARFNTRTAIQTATVSADDFTFDGSAVSSAVLLPDGETISLEVPAFAVDTTHTISVGAADLYNTTGEPSVAATVAFSYAPATIEDANPNLDLAHVDVIFDADAALDPVTVSASDFTIPGLTVSAASVIGDGKTVRLTTSAQTRSATYTVSTPDLAVATVKGSLSAASSFSFYGYSPPLLVRAVPVDIAHVDLLFDSAVPLDPASVRDDMFWISGFPSGASVTAAELLPDGYTVRLTALQVSDRLYQVDAGSWLDNVDGASESGSQVSFHGYSPPEFVRTRLVGPDQVEIYMGDSDVALDGMSVSPSDFTVSGSTVTSATLQDPDVMSGLSANRTVRLTVSPAFTAGTTYTVSAAAGSLQDAEWVTSLAGSESLRYDPPVVSSSIADESSFYVDIVFDRGLGEHDSSNVSIPGLTVAGAGVRPDGVTLRVSTSEQSYGVTYTATLEPRSVFGTTGTPNETQTTEFAGFGAPRVTSIQAIDANTVDVTYDSVDSLDPTSVSTSNYSFAVAPLGMVSASLLGDGQTVRLVTTAQTEGVEYGINGLTTPSDLSGRGAVHSAVYTFRGYWPITISDVVALNETTLDVDLDSMSEIVTSSVQPTDFSVSDGIGVSAAAVEPNGRTIRLQVDTMTAEAAYTVNLADGAVSDGTFTSVASSASATYSPPYVESALAVDDTHVDVVFAGGVPLDGTSVDPADFTIPGLTVSAAALEPDDKTVRLTTSAQSKGTTYTVSVLEAGVNSAGGTACVADFYLFAGYWPPSVVSAEVIDSTTVDIEFDSRFDLDAGTISAADFGIGGLAVTDAALRPDGTTVRLTTASQSKGVTYTVSIGADRLADTMPTNNIAGNAQFSGHWPPTIADAIAVNATTVDLTLDVRSAADSATVGTGDFTVAGVTVLDAATQPDGTTVRLTTTAMIAGNSYTADLAVGSVAGVEGELAAASSQGFDYDPPTLQSATAVDSTHVDVTFASPSALVTATVETTDFSIPGLSVTGTEMRPDGVTVRLQTSSHTKAATYTVTVGAGTVMHVGGTESTTSSVGFAGYWPVTISSATSVDRNTVDVVLDSEAAIDGATVVSGDFSITGFVSVTDAVLQPDDQTVRLTTANQAPGTAYTVSLADDRIADVSGNNSEYSQKTFNAVPNPYITGAYAENGNSVSVSIAKASAIDTTTVQASDFSIAGLVVTGAAVSESGYEVILTTEDQSVQSYTVSIADGAFSDIGANQSIASSATFTGLLPATLLGSGEQVWMTDTSENWVVWEEYVDDMINPPHQGISIYDRMLETHVGRIENAMSDATSPSVSLDTVVYADNRNGNWDIYSMDLMTMMETQITTHPSDQTEPSIDWPFVVWTDMRNGNADIYVYDLTTSMESRVTDDSSQQAEPYVGDGMIVWADWRNGNADIYMNDLSLAAETQVTDDSADQVDPVTTGDMVGEPVIVWTDARNMATTGWDIYMRDLDSGLDSRLTSGTAGAHDQFLPTVALSADLGTDIAWVSWDGMSQDIYYYDFSSEETRRVTSSPMTHDWPSLWNGKCTYVRDEGIDKKVFMADLP